MNEPTFLSDKQRANRLTKGLAVFAALGTLALIAGCGSKPDETAAGSPSVPASTSPMSPAQNTTALPAATPPPGAGTSRPDMTGPGPGAGAGAPPSTYRGAGK